MRLPLPLLPSVYSASRLLNPSVFSFWPPLPCIAFLSPFPVFVSFFLLGTLQACSLHSTIKPLTLNCLQFFSFSVGTRRALHFLSDMLCTALLADLSQQLTTQSRLADEIAWSSGIFEHFLKKEVSLRFPFESTCDLQRSTFDFAASKIAWTRDVVLDCRGFNILEEFLHLSFELRVVAACFVVHTSTCLLHLHSWG